MEYNNSLSYSNQSFISKLLKHAAVILMIVLIILISVWIRAFIGAMKNYNKGKDSFDREQYIMAITFFDRSMHWYTPFNPYVERSAEYLWEISKQSEQINDKKMSIIALETIRNGFYSARSFYSPGINWIDRCETKIGSIDNSQKESILQEDNYDGKNTIYSSNMEYNDPNIFWTIILEVGLFGWIGSILGFIYFYLGADNNRYVRKYYLWILAAGVTYGLWIIGMIEA